jgi:hypothetical protein
VREGRRFSTNVANEISAISVPVHRYHEDKSSQNRSRKRENSMVNALRKDGVRL